MYEQKGCRRRCSRNRDRACSPLSSVTVHASAASSQCASVTALRNWMSRRRSNLPATWLQVVQRVGLGRKMLLPIPFLHQLLGERVAVRPAFRIEAGSGVAVPVPRAPDIASGLEDTRRHAQFAQAIQHEHAGNAGANDDRVERRGGGRPRLLHHRNQVVHLYVLCRYHEPYETGGLDWLPCGISPAFGRPGNPRRMGS